MEILVWLVAILGVGYILGVWTACAVFGQPQRAYEDSTTKAPIGLKIPFETCRRP